MQSEQQALINALKLLKPIRQNRLRKSERRVRQEKAELEKRKHTLEQRQQALQTQQQEQQEQRQALAQQNQSRPIPTKDLTTWLQQESQSIEKVQLAAHEVTNTEKSIEQQNQTLEHIQEEVAQLRIENERLDIMAAEQEDTTQA